MSGRVEQVVRTDEEKAAIASKQLPQHQNRPLIAQQINHKLDWTLNV